ncbi:hypothetical protein HY745_04415 [Candidatus Desantisbacteria bacterium]|nr:hypothetical protein [Candidatus Desantisbacteria bacterium]
MQAVDLFAWGIFRKYEKKILNGMLYLKVKLFLMICIYLK